MSEDDKFEEILNQEIRQSPPRTRVERTAFDVARDY